MNGEDRKRMNRLEQKLDKYGEDISTIKANQEPVIADIQAIKKKLLGNEREGICDTITTHKTYFKILGSCLVILSTAVIGLIVKIIWS